MTVQQIAKILEEWAPTSYAEEWDNVGLLIGDAEQQVTKILVALDATQEVVNEAVNGGYNLLVCHHPLIYNPINKITAETPQGRKILALIRNNIAFYCAHTNLDATIGGINDILAQKIGLTDIKPLIEIETETAAGIGRMGNLPKPTTLADLAQTVKTALQSDLIRLCGDGKKPIKKVGICGGDGTGSRYIGAAIKEQCDVYITGDLRYHGAQDALESGISLIDITHYSGEAVIIEEIVKYLQKFSNNIQINATKVNGQVFSKI